MINEILESQIKINEAILDLIKCIMNDINSLRISVILLSIGFLAFFFLTWYRFRKIERRLENETGRNKKAN